LLYYSDKVEVVNSLPLLRLLVTGMSLRRPGSRLDNWKCVLRCTMCPREGVSQSTSLFPYQYGSINIPYLSKSSKFQLIKEQIGEAWW